MRSWIPLLVVAACGTAPPAPAPKAPSDGPATCLRFTALPAVVAPPSPAAAVAPRLVARPQGGWYLGWRSAPTAAQHVRRLDPTLFPVGLAEAPLATGVGGDVGIAPDPQGVLLVWRAGPVLRAWRRDPELGPAGAPVDYRPVDGGTLGFAQSVAASSTHGLVLVWRGTEAPAPYTLWDVDESGAFPPGLPEVADAVETGPGALASAGPSLLAVWPQRLADAPWTLRVVQVGQPTPVDLATLPGAPEGLQAVLGDVLLAAWRVGGHAWLAHGGPSGVPLGDPIDLGPASDVRVATDGQREVAAWGSEDLRLRRVDVPGCADARPASDLAAAGGVDVALDGSGHGAVVWEGVGPSGAHVLWGRPFELLDPPPSTAP